MIILSGEVNASAPALTQMESKNRTIKFILNSGLYTPLCKNGLNGRQANNRIILNFDKKATQLNVVLLVFIDSHPSWMHFICIHSLPFYILHCLNSAAYHLGKPMITDCATKWIRIFSSFSVHGKLGKWWSNPGFCWTNIYHHTASKLCIINQLSILF